jgi:uncharacterized protein involved in tolerance to divalent cations
MTREERAFVEALQRARSYAVWLGELTPDERLHVAAKEHRRVVATLRDRLRHAHAQQGEGER